MTPPAPPTPRGSAVFTARLAMLFATIAFSIDAMLPALPTIAADLTPDAPNRAQLILSVFVLGMGLGTLLVGPLSDAWGRKPVLIGGLVIYLIAALVAHQATSLEMLLAARMVQGFGAAAPRVVSLALVRDLFSGRDMARIMSIVMMVFMIVPALAPLVGQGIIHLAGWRAIFLAYVAFAFIALVWFGLGQPETHPAERRRPLRPALLAEGLREVLAAPEVRLYTIITGLGFGQMLGLLSSIQQIFDQGFDRAEEFPLWFALIAAIAATGSFFNSRLVGRVGMRRMATLAYVGQVILSVVTLGVFLLGHPTGNLAFAAFYVWATSIFFIAGLTFGNLNALAMQKMGHLAGLATSVISSLSTVLSAAIAAVTGLMFNGTPVPAMLTAVACSTLATLLMRRAARL